MEAALSGIDDHFAVFDREWRYVYINEKGAGVLGRRREELLGRKIWELFPEAVGNQFYQEVHRAVAEGLSIHSEHHYTVWDRWFENHIYPFPGGVCVLSSEITERKKAQQKRERRVLQLETVARQMPAAVMIADAAGDLVFCNKQVALITGFEFPSGTGNERSGLQPAFQALWPDGRPVQGGEWPLARALQSGEVVRNQELVVLRADGKRVVIEVNAAPVRDEEGQVVAAVAMFLDATDRKRAEEALREADRRKDEFLAMLAHELRNPLAPIRNAVQVMGALETGEPRMDWCREVIERQADHLTRLVDDLLDISRITQGKIVLHKEQVELAAVVARAVETVRPLIDGRGHRLTVSLPEHPVFLDADLVRLAQAVSNLLNNAVKYTRDGGEIGILATLEGAEVVLRVRDNGIGIPPELLPAVFDLFIQADRSLARSEGGLGIGLTLVRNLVEMHGGQVEARSDGPGQGSELTLRLPVLVHPRQEKAPVPAGPEAAVAGRSILIVDDNPDSAESLALLLGLQGHEVRTAGDGPTAIETARSFRPQIVFLDIGLPGMDGYEVARRMRAEPGLAGAFLIAMTGYGREEDVRRSLESGFDRHLVKPLDFAELDVLLRG